MKHFFKLNGNLEYVLRTKLESILVRKGSNLIDKVKWCIKRGKIKNRDEAHCLMRQYGTMKLKIQGNPVECEVLNISSPTLQDNAKFCSIFERHACMCKIY